MNAHHLPSGRIAQGLRGAVAADHPIVASAGLGALEAGGTALDACLAMAATAWVVMPDMCGPGGDLFALWREPDGKVQAINGAGHAPAAFAPGDPAGRAGYVLAPGAPAAVHALHEAGCRLDLARLFKPAVAVALSGFVVGPRFERQLQALPAGAFRTSLAELHGGVLPGRGERFVMPGLAESLSEWARAGGAGSVLAAAVDDWRQDGAALTDEEARRLRVAREDPLLVRLGAWDIFGQPPMSQAVGTLAALAIAGPDVLRHADGAYRDHMLIEAYKHAYREMQSLGEGRDVAAAVAAALDPHRMRSAREAIGPRATVGPVMIRNYGETTQCAAADAEGRVCTLIHSLYRPFGARLLSRRTGWIANDRGATFTDGPNAAAPGRRPRNTLVGVLATHADGSTFALGTPGAQAQTQTNLQVLADLIRNPDDPWSAIAHPRWSFIGEDRVCVEACFAPERLVALESMGHRLALRPPVDWLMGSVSLAAFRGGIASAYADHRREALALAL